MMKYLRSNKSSVLALALAGALLGGAQAGEVVSAKGGPAIIEEEPSLYDKLWAIPVLYKNSDNFWLQEFKLIGRYQGQYASVDSHQGSYDDWENRRWRIGAEAKILGGDWKIAGQINIDDEFNPFYGSIDEAYIGYSPSKAFGLKIGKQKPKWSYEYSTTSRKILTFERSLIVNNLSPDKATGITAAGKLENGFLYSLGIYSGDVDDEFGGFDAGIFGLGSIGYDYSDRASRLDEAVVRLDWLYNGSEENNATSAYRHSFSLNHSMAVGAFGLHTDLIYADGYVGDAYGFVVLPSYDITEKLQVVGRYSYSYGSNDTLRAQSRYERKVPDITDGGHGGAYNSFYAGLNYYLYGHKLKLMTGIEYSVMDDKEDNGGDFTGWTWFGGVRMYF